MFSEKVYVVINIKNVFCDCYYMFNIESMRSELYNMIYEAVENSDKFNKFCKLLRKFADECIVDVKDEILNQIWLDAKIIDYNFERKRWLGAYVGGSVDSGCIEIGINYNLIYKMMVERRVATDRFNIEAQGRITVAHEIAHGLIEYIRWTLLEIVDDYFDDFDSDVQETFNKYIEMSESEEEAIVEEFGEMFFEEATYVSESELNDDLKVMFDALRNVGAL